MKLIDIDKLIEDFRNTITENSDTFDWLNMISRQPTAYDVDKVVERLEESSTDDDGIVCYVKEKPVLTKELAIKIVKAGGIK